MSTPRIDVDLRKIRCNTRRLVEGLKPRGIGVTPVTKAVCGHPAIARAMLDGGATGLAEARLSNVKRLRQAGITCPITMIRTPVLSQVDDVVRLCETSYNTQTTVIAALAAAALRQDTVHGVILMVEMGDLREGIMPQDVGDMAQYVVDLPGVALRGIGANFACLNDSAPDAADMQVLSAIANDVEGQCGPVLETISGGNSANLPWAFGQNATGRINDLRIGEAILLGVYPPSGEPIAGLFQDALVLVAEVIEVDTKSVRPLLRAADPNLAGLRLVPNGADTSRMILAIGQQDTDTAGLAMPFGNTFVGATSDHLVVSTRHEALNVGSEVRFQMQYGALMRAMAAPDIQTSLRNDRPAPTIHTANGRNQNLALV